MADLKVGITNPSDKVAFAELGTEWARISVEGELLKLDLDIVKQLVDEFDAGRNDEIASIAKLVWLAYNLGAENGKNK